MENNLTKEDLVILAKELYSVPKKYKVKLSEKLERAEYLKEIKLRLRKIK